MKLSPHDIRRLAVEAMMSERTVASVYGLSKDGRTPKASSVERLRKAAKALKLPAPPP